MKARKPEEPNYEYHPLANIFPMLEKERLEELATDIYEHGLQVPIVLHEGKILEGRNRYQACQIAGIEPTFQKHDQQKDPLDYVISLNLHRRHLSAGQRAMVATEITNLKPGDKQFVGASNEATSPIGQKQAAKIMNTSCASVQRAVKVKTASPELAQKVKAGKVKLGAAEREIDKAKKPAEPKPLTEAKVKAQWQTFVKGYSDINRKTLVTVMLQWLKEAKETFQKADTT